MALYTLDEARTAFVRSALAVLHDVHTADLGLTRLIAGAGSRKSLAPHERSVVYVHWALLADLEASGYGWAIHDEVEGIVSCLEAEGAAGAAATIATELPEFDDGDLGVVAA